MLLTAPAGEKFNSIPLTPGLFQVMPNQRFRRETMEKSGFGFGELMPGLFVVPQNPISQPPPPVQLTTPNKTVPPNSVLTPMPGQTPTPTVMALANQDINTLYTSAMASLGGGDSMTTMLMVGAAAVGAYFLFRKRGRG